MSAQAPAALNGCGITNLSDCVGEIAGGVAESIFEQFLQWMGEAAVAVIKLVITGWVKLPTPVLGEDSGAVPYLHGYLMPVTYVVMVIAMMVAGARMAYQMRGEDARELATSMIKFVVLVGLGTALVNLLAGIGDEYSTWILNLTTEGVAGQSLADKMARMFDTGIIVSLTGGAAMFLFLLIVLSGLIQVVMVYIRFAILVLLVVMLPIAAAAGLTREGRPMLDRYITWGVAWILWKPVAATIYATGFALVAHGNDGTAAVTGLATLAMAVFALPSLMRLLAPITAATGSGSVSGGGIATGALAAGAMMRRGSSKGRGPDTSRMKVNNATNSNGPSGAKSARSGWRAGKGAGKAAAAAGKAAAVAKGAAVAYVAASVAAGGAVAEGAKRGAESATGERP